MALALLFWRKYFLAFVQGSHHFFPSAPFQMYIAIDYGGIWDTMINEVTIDLFRCIATRAIDSDSISNKSMNKSTLFCLKK